jgi:hypothetical protein
MVYKYMQYFLSLLRTGNNGDGDVDEEELVRCADAN